MINLRFAFYGYVLTGSYCCVGCLHLLLYLGSRFTLCGYMCDWRLWLILACILFDI